MIHSDSELMTERKRRCALATISRGDEKRAGALLDAELYDAPVDLAGKMAVNLRLDHSASAWRIRDGHTTEPVVKLNDLLSL